jgi:DNA-binding NtrC family response regulator
MSKIRVLLVDDDVGFTSSMRMVLSHRGFDVTVAANGLTALPLIAGERFDVVLLDVKMPGMEGTQVLKEIKRFAPDIPVIMLTGHYSSSEEEDTLRRDAYAYLLKPCPILELVGVIVSAGTGKDTVSNS